MFIYSYLLVFYFVANLSGTNITHKRKADDDYYLNYDYELLNNSIDAEVQSDSLILPIPNDEKWKESSFNLPKVEIPDNSLADTDLKDHDFIDSLMYVYYGANTPSKNLYSIEIIIFGAILSGFAQLITAIITMTMKRNENQKEMQFFFLQISAIMCVSKFALVFGVHRSRNHLNCLSTAFILHYLYLLPSFWMFIYCLYIYKLFGFTSLKIKYIYFYGYGVPLIFSLVSFLISPKSFETRKFCFMSVQKGMILNYMIPVSALILLTMFYCLNGVRKITMELIKLEFNSSFESLNISKNELNDDKKSKNEGEILSLRSARTCLKLVCVCQTVYAIEWFALVLALENLMNDSSMAGVYALLTIFLNFYILLRSKCFFPTLVSITESVTTEEETTSEVVKDHDVTPNKQGSSDSIPLLINIESSPELKAVPQDYISTISVN